MVGPVFQAPMSRVSDTDLLVMTMRVERLAEAVISYGFWPLQANGMPQSNRPGGVDGRYRGPDAPAEAPSNRELVGTTFDHALESDALGEPRKVTVYKPPGHSPAEKLPVVYATDGAMFAPYARRLDAAIEAEMSPRVVVVAAHGGPVDHRGNIRALEYLPQFDPARFDRHQRFFVDELARWATDELGVSNERAERAVFGCSDGGGHALATAQAHSDRFGHVFAYSTGMPPEPYDRWDPDTAPMAHLCAGTLEGPFHLATEAWAGWLSILGVEHHWTERVCGHDLIQWIEELPRAITRAFDEN